LTSRACAAGLSDIFLFPALDPAGPSGYEVSAAVFAMKPASRGSVRLNSSDPRTPLQIDHGFLSDPDDAAVLAEGVERLREIAATDAVRRLAGRETRPGSDVDAMTHIRAAARGFFHPVGTCAIGRVVDGHGRVYGLDGLAIVDASIMPTIPRANTNLSTIALAERIADTLVSA
jgi:choline dehydrogenase